MSYKNKEKQKDYQRTWYQRKKNGEETALLKKQVSVEDTKKRINRNRAKYRKRSSEYIREKLGECCIICEYKNRLISHKKDGKKHKLFFSMGWKQLQSVDMSEFVCVCWKCHKHIHWCMDNLNMSWDDIEKRFKEK